MRNIMALALIGLCVPQSGVASTDIRLPEGTAPALFHTVNTFDQRATQQSLVFLRERIAQLQRENEQLRNSIASLRSQKYSAPSPENTGRLQALIEENNRLANIVARQNNGTTPSTEYFVRELNAAQAKNKALQERLKTAQLGNALKYQEQIASYQKENAYLKSQITQNTAQSQNYKTLESEMSKLKASNEALRLKLGLANQALDTEKQKQKVNDQSAKLASLDKMVQQLKAQNQSLSQQVKDAHLKVHAATLQSSTEQKSQVASYTKTIQDLRAQLERANIEKKDLHAKIIAEQGKAKAQQEQQEKPQKDILALKKQNESLRETIRALNESLVSSDNAGQTVERLLSENKALQHQLKLAKQAQNSNAGSAKELLVQNQNLKVQLLERDKKISQLEGLKDTVKALRAQGDVNAVNRKQYSELQEKVDLLSAQNQTLSNQVEQEKKNSSAYRAKIREYQEKIASMAVTPVPENIEPASGSSTLTGSPEFYKKKLRVLESNIEKQKNAISALRQENQKLKSQLDQKNNQSGQENFSAEDLLNQDLNPLP